MDDEVAKFLAEHHWEKEESPDWAIRCLEKGYDSKSLRMLASMSKWDSASELNYYFQRSLKELGWDDIEEHVYLMKYAKILAREIVEGEIDAIKASQNIYQIFVALDYPVEMQGWYEIDEMIYDYNYFLKTGKEGPFYLSKEQLISEIKKASEELIKSKEEV